MNDQELFRLLQDKTPEELTLGEIELLRRRLTESDELRQTLREQLEMEQYLSQALGRIDIDIETLFARGTEARASWLGKTGTLLSSLLLLATLGVVAIFIYVEIRSNSPADGDQVAKSSKDDEEAQNDEDSEDRSPKEDEPEEDPEDPNEIDQQPPDQVVTGRDDKQPDDEPPPTEFVVEAEDFADGDLQTTDLSSADGSVTVLQTAAASGFAEYDIDIPVAGRYQLHLRYAALESRPLSISIDDTLVSQFAAMQQTGGTAAGDTREFHEATVALEAGPHKLRISANGPFPLLDQWRLRRVEPAKPPTGDDESKPWLNTLAAAPVSFDQTWRESVDRPPSPLGKEDVKKWLAPVPGEHHHFADRDISSVRYCQAEGMLKLLAPLPEDTVLRMSLASNEKLRIHLYSGNTGVMLRCFHNWGEARTAYATTRDPGKAKPKSFSMASSDGQKTFRNETRYGQSYLLWHRNGEVTLSIGDVILVRAPLEGAINDIYFEGKVCFDELSLVPVREFPPTERARPVIADMLTPADLDWEHEKASEQITFVKNEDGSVELSGKDNKGAAWISTELPICGVTMVEAMVEDVQPGAYIGLSADKPVNSGGETQYERALPAGVVGFAKNNDTGRLCVRIGGNTLSGDSDHLGRLDDKVEQCVAPPVWVRFLVSPKRMKYWLSADGIRWAGPLEMHIYDRENYKYLTLGCWSNTKVPKIRLRRIVCRQLDHLSGLADAKLLDRAGALPYAENIGPWMTQVLDSRPGDVPIDAWCCASAINTLAAGCKHGLSFDLADLIVSSNAYQELPRADKLAVLDDLGLVYEFFGMGSNDRPERAMKDLFARYRAACRQTDEGEVPRPASRYRKAVMTAPFCVRREFKTLLPEDIEREIVELVFHRNWARLQQFCREIQFFVGSEHNRQQIAPLLPWARAIAVRRQPSRADRSAFPMRPQWRHPLIEELSKDAYSFQVEFQAAIDRGDFDDACRLITTVNPRSTAGLTPSADDPQLRVSLKAAIETVLSSNSSLTTAMIEQYGKLALLRVRQSMNDGDKEAVHLATFQYPGTQAAGEASRWLGDRAVSSGYFTQALSHYHDAKPTLSPLARGDLGPRIRLAASMLGREEGERATAPVQFGDISMSAAEFEAVIADMLKTHAGATLAPNGAANDPLESIKPASFNVHKRGAFDGEKGGHSGPPFGAFRGEDIQWVDRQLSYRVDGDWLFLSNRYQVIAYDLNNGRQRWKSSGVPGGVGKQFDWPMIQMRPLVTKDRVFTRILKDKGPVLACLDRNNGRNVWTYFESSETILSDPFVLRGELAALTLGPGSLGTHWLRLTTFDAQSGAVVAHRPLVHLRSTWFDRNLCEVVVRDDSFVAVLGGVVLACEADGDVRWLRRQEVTPAAEDNGWGRKYFAPPAVKDDYLYILQPGVYAVDCVQWRTGKLVWQRVMPQAQRLMGVVDDGLIVRTDDGIERLRTADGSTVWRHEAVGLLNTSLCGGEGGIMIGQLGPVATDGKRVPVLVWLDPETGKPTGHFPLDTYSFPLPQLGQAIPYKGRLWLLVGRDHNDQRRELIELQPKGPPPIVVGQSLEAPIWSDLYLPQYREAVNRVLPGWSLVATTPVSRPEYLNEYYGDRVVVKLGARYDAPAILAQQVSFPAGSKPRLKVRVRTGNQLDWTVAATLNGKQLASKDLKSIQTDRGWTEFELDLSTGAGQSGWLFFRAGSSSTSRHMDIFLKKLEISL